MTGRGSLGDILIQFFLVSFLAIGGANAVIPELHRMAVEGHHWMSDTTFTDLFALAQVTPGPNVILVTLIGWYVAGIPGAIGATLAMCVPVGTLAFALTRISHRFRDAPLRFAIQRGLSALTIGVVLASAYILMRASDINWQCYVVTAVSVAGSLLTKRHPLWWIGIGAAAGVAGLL